MNSISNNPPSFSIPSLLLITGHESYYGPWILRLGNYLSPTFVTQIPLGHFLYTNE